MSLPVLILYLKRSPPAIFLTHLLVDRHIFYLFLLKCCLSKTRNCLSYSLQYLTRNRCEWIKDRWMNKIKLCEGGGGVCKNVSDDPTPTTITFIALLTIVVAYSVRYWVSLLCISLSHSFSAKEPFSYLSLHAQHLAQYLTASKCSTSICIMNEWMNMSHLRFYLLSQLLILTKSLPEWCLLALIYILSLPKLVIKTCSRSTFNCPHIGRERRCPLTSAPQTSLFFTA